MRNEIDLELNQQTMQFDQQQKKTQNEFQIFEEEEKIYEMTLTNEQDQQIRPLKTRHKDLQAKYKDLTEEIKKIE